MDLSSMSQVSTLVAVPARTPSASPAADAPAPASDTAEDGSGNQNSGAYPGEPVDQVEVSQSAGPAPEPWVDRTPTEPLVDRSFPVSDRVERLDFKV
tara:strand:- start:105628 stop:105918 length:291 start_codon:yes stop_codon:yes gene_type:complete